MSEAIPDAETPDRRVDDPRFKKLFFEVGQLKSQHQETIKKLDLNTQATLDVKKNTEDIVTAWAAISGGLKVLGWLGTCAKYFAYFAGAISATAGAWYALTHLGSPPPPPDIPR